MNAPMVEMRGVTASYGASQALFGVDLTLPEGGALALMGRNGMGKSTTLKTLCGLLRPSDGRIRFAGSEITGLPAHRIARRGLGLVPEGRRCFTPLTVAENLTATARPGPWDLDRVASLFPRLAERWDQRAASLSGGEQQMLAIGRALMTNPRLLVLDEATEGLAPVVRREIWAAVAQLRAQGGLSLILVDKSLRELRQVADGAVILARGKTVWAGDMGDLTSEGAARWLGV
ncbi:ABC transporter ATP-binding protein [Dinoroseobacter sp. S76]|uniref:ABC transporter ATP-binding protein n=1 Tax=Dinoroseobacter sp. S76 TaxID=3415124 RepID=UPI003C7DCB80